MKRTKTHIDVATIPPTLHPYLKGAEVYNSNCSETAHTFFIQGKENYYLKVNRAGSLSRESKMTMFLSSHNLSTNVVAYMSDEKHDYLLTEAIPGEDGISGEHLSDPKRLAITFGKSLRTLHSLPVGDCPFTDRTTEMFTDVENNIWKNKFEYGIVPEGLTEAVSKFTSMKHIIQNDVILHGDYCLPNIIMDHFELTGFIDLGYGGFGDRHYDLFWGTWTLNYNFKTNKYKNLFLDAYGRDVLDLDRLEVSRIIAGLNF